MNITFKILGLVGATMAAAVLVAQGPNSGPKAGTAAPDFTLPAASGKTHSLSDFKGKYVVLEWTNHQCPIVRRHYDSGNMQGLQKWATGKGVVWLSICSSAQGKQGFVTADEAKQVVKEDGSNSTAYLLDPEGKVGRLYAAKTTPHMFVIDPKGTVVYAGGIDDGQALSKAETKNAHNYVKAALQESSSGKEVSVKAAQPYGCTVKY